MPRHVTIEVPDDHLIDAASFHGCPVVGNVVVPAPRPVERKQTFLVEVVTNATDNPWTREQVRRMVTGHARPWLRLSVIERAD